MSHKGLQLQLQLLLIMTLLLSGCTVHNLQKEEEKTPQKRVQEKPQVRQKNVNLNVNQNEKYYTLNDLQTIPQQSSFYAKNLSLKEFSQDSFFKKYYRVWNITQLSASLYEVMWPYRSFSHTNSYGENLQPLDKIFFDQMMTQSNFEEFATLNKKAITLDHLDMRAFPTQRPLFKNPSQAGEGFPFDYLQNSTIFANEPLLVSHYSKDKKWVFVESNFAFGWVKSKDILFLTQEETDILQKKEQIFITQEEVPCYEENGAFLYHLKVGMIFALVEEDRENYRVFLPTKNKNIQDSFAKIKKNDAHKGFVPFNESNINKLLDQIADSKYGWGGMYGQKDCSSTLRDFYAPFGIWLPRNSSMQARKGLIVSLKNLTNDEKITIIREKAIPFQTLLYKPGHIVMYVGIYNDQIVVFQNVWGIKTKEHEKEGRFVVGKAVFSTLELGKELEYYDVNSSLLKTITSMNILTQ